MGTDITLRSGVMFRVDAAGEGRIEFAKARRVDGVRLLGTVAAASTSGEMAEVRVLSAVVPTSLEKIGTKAHFPGLTVVAVETQPLHTDRATLPCLFYLPSFVEGVDLDPARTVVLTTHGGVAGGDEERIWAGSPCVPGERADQWCLLDPPAVATLVRWIRGPGGEAIDALVNFGCFSSTPRRRDGITFNQELAALLAPQGVDVYGPPHAGVVTAATMFGQWHDLFGQRQEDGATVRSVPIKFQRIAAPTGIQHLESTTTGGAATVHGTLVVTNDFALAGDLCSCSPDFADVKRHDLDRAMME